MTHNKDDDDCMCDECIKWLDELAEHFAKEFKEGKLFTHEHIKRKYNLD